MGCPVGHTASRPMARTVGYTASHTGAYATVENGKLVDRDCKSFFAGCRAARRDHYKLQTGDRISLLANLLRRASNFSSACFGSPVRRWQTVVSAKLKTRPNFERTQCTVCTIQHSGNRWNYCTHGSSGRLYRARHTRRVWCIYHGASATVPLPRCLCHGASAVVPLPWAQRAAGACGMKIRG